MKTKRRHVLITMLCICLALCLCGCSRVEKKITVVVREQGSGTREAFDNSVTDGVRFLVEKDENGRTRYHTTVNAVVLTKTGALLSSIASDVHAIGYLSLGSLNDSVRAVAINGIFPTEEHVIDGSYPLRRPYVILTTDRTSLSPRAADFLRYLKSDAAEAHVTAADCFFLTDPAKRANPGEPPIEVGAFSPLAALPEGERIVIRGSTSPEKLILSAAKDYAACYGVDAATLFDIQLEGSSVGRKAVENDSSGNVIGLSSASVTAKGIHSFNLCVDAIAVAVHPANTAITSLTLGQLFDIFSGRIEYFSQITEGASTP